MARHHSHYEAAFEDYVRSHGHPYVLVDEGKKAIFADVSIKSFDFVVYSASGPNLLVDVKGRKFPGPQAAPAKRPSRPWENWITREDVTGLRQWREIFGEDYLPVLVFAYWLQGPAQRGPFEEVHVFRGKHYAFVAFELEHYVTLARPRSAKWQTITVPARVFSRQAMDVARLL
ncbi:MAG: HYExAFE family protein [Planctomycetota bacterium]|jgi:hypothetical protein